MRCDKIRGTHIDWYKRCQLNYRYTAHDRKMPDIIVPRWSVLGWVVHKTLEVAVTSKRYASNVFKEMIKIEKDIVREEVASTFPDYKLRDHEIPTINADGFIRGTTMMRNWDKHANYFWSADEAIIEEPFSVDLDPKVGAVMTGRIDLQLRFGDTIEIWDYKSTQPLYEYKKVPPQLLRYAIGICLQKDLRIKKVRSVLFNLQSGNILKRDWTAGEANGMIDHLVDVVDEIKDTPPEEAKASVGSHCRTLCQYHPSCPAYLASQKRR